MIRKLLLVTLMVAFVVPSAFASDLFKLVPQEADFVFHLSLEKLLATEGIRDTIDTRLSENPQQKAAFDEFVRNTGFNPLKDLNNVVVFSSGQVQAGASAQTAGAIFQGNFEAEKIFEAIKKDEKASQDVEITKIDGFDAIIPADRDEGYGIFLEKGIAVIGAEKGVMAAKDVKTGKAKNIETKEDFYKVVKRMNTSAALSGAGNIPAELKAKLQENPQAAPLAAINYFFFDFDHGETIRFNFNGAVDKAENVQAVTTSLNGFLAMLKMFAAQAPEAAEILNLVNISSEGNAVRINLNVPKSKLDNIRNQMEQRMQQMQQPPRE